MAAVVDKSSDEALVLVVIVCDEAVVGYLCSDNAFLTEHLCVVVDGCSRG